MAVVTRATPPFFLVGNPRSGTKMLRELLNVSPDLWMSDVESHFIPKYTRTVARYGDLADRQNFQRLTDDLRKARAFWQWEHRGVHVETEAWYRACPRHDWPGVIAGLFQCVRAAEIKDPPKPWAEVVWGDKTPVYMGEVGLLDDVFPQARFIHIVRDPRDCCLSSEDAWGNASLRTAHEWAQRVRACRTAGLALGPERYREIRYEDLIEDVPRVLGGLFDFLGVPTPPDAGRFLRVPENLGAAKGANRVVATNKQKWKTKMEPALRRQIEGLTGDLLDAYGYEREHPTLPTRALSPLQLNAYRVRDAWRQLQFRRRELGSWSEAVRFLRAR
jgi:Sulfotransferase family